MREWWQWLFMTAVFAVPIIALAWGWQLFVMCAVVLGTRRRRSLSGIEGEEHHAC